MVDLTVTIINVHGPHIARSKRASASDNQTIESRFRAAQKNIQISSDTIESLVRAAWTEGDTDSPRVGNLDAPHLSSCYAPTRSLSPALGFRRHDQVHLTWEFRYRELAQTSPLRRTPERISQKVYERHLSTIGRRSC